MFTFSVPAIVVLVMLPAAALCLVVLTPPGSQFEKVVKNVCGGLAALLFVVLIVMLANRPSGDKLTDAESRATGAATPLLP